MKATVSVPTAPPTDPAVPPAARAAGWPEWFVALDAVLAIVALALAFLMASFAARNSDVWLHLASGRQIAAGEWSLGGDPLSFVAPDRPWVRTSWLTDLVGYVLYQADPSGVVLVAGKAALFAAAFGVFYWLRRPGHSLWPWAVAGTLAALAAAPYASLRPAVVSVAFLSLTLVLIYRLPWRTRPWRAPLILAGVFAVWANADAWFFLGPLALLCVLVGEALNRTLLGEAPAVSADGDPFPPAPPVAGLAKALLVGVAACLLNPFLIAGLVKDPGEAVAQLLPMELGFGLPAGASDDFDLASLTLTPMSPAFRTQTNLGNGVNGYSYAALLVLGGVALAAGFARLRAAQVLLWVAFAALSFAHVRLIPYFAVVAVPVIAGHLNGLAGGISIGGRSDPRTRILLTACGVGRVLCILLGVVMLAATYPGWLHPRTAATSQNRLDWSLEPEAGLERSAVRMREMRAAGLVPGGGRGLGVSPEFANYLAWHAPEVRAFVNSRFAFHRAELPDLLAARRILNSKRVDPATPNESLLKIKEVNRVAAERAVDYLVVASGASQRTDALTLLQLINDAGWVVWHLDGRLTLLGRLTGDAAADAQVQARRIDTARLAFGPDVPRLPESVPVPPTPLAVELAEQYVVRPLPVPPEADDAAVYGVYAEYARQAAEAKYNRATAVGQMAVMGVLGGGRVFPTPPRPIEDEGLTLPVLMIRAARLAIVKNPDVVEAYSELAEAYALPGAPVIDSPFFGDLTERQVQIMSAHRRMFDRAPQVLGNGVAPLVLLNSALSLTEFYEQTGQADAAQQIYAQYVSYFDSLPQGAQQELAASITPGGGKPEEALKARRTEMSNRQDQFSRIVQRGRDAVARAPDPLAQFNAAAQSGLPLLAIEIFNTIPSDGSVTIPPQAALTKVALELRAGLLDAAVADLAALEPTLQQFARQGPADEIARGFRQMQTIATRLAGNPGADSASMPRPEFPRVQFNPLSLRAPQVLVGLSAAAGGLVGLLQSDQVVESRAPVVGHLRTVMAGREILLRDSVLCHDLALLALLDGNTADARRWFVQALQPQGVSLKAIGDTGRAARVEKYIELIDRAQLPPAYQK